MAEGRYFLDTNALVAFINNATLLTQDQTLIRAMEAMGWAAQAF